MLKTNNTRAWVARGVTAALSAVAFAGVLLGAVPAVVIGGVLTILLALVWPKFFPALAHVDRLEDVKPSPASLGEVLPVGRAGPPAAPEPAD